MVGSKKKVLYVESDPKEHAQMNDMIQGSICHLGSALDGITAFQKVSEDHYDLVISEINLPQMDGFDLLVKNHGAEAMVYGLGIQLHQFLDNLFRKTLPGRSATNRASR